MLNIVYHFSQIKENNNMLENKAIMFSDTDMENNGIDSEAGEDGCHGWLLVVTETHIALCYVFSCKSMYNGHGYMQVIYYYASGQANSLYCKQSMALSHFYRPCRCTGWRENRSRIR